MLDTILDALVGSTDEPHRWLLVRVAMALLGGVCAHIVENERRLRATKARIHFFWRGVTFALVSALGGLCLLDPAEARTAFAAGLIGWYAIISFMSQQNKGMSDGHYEERPLTAGEISQLGQE